MRGEREYKGQAVQPNVSRVDCLKAKGWQVRWPGHSKFFSDSLNGGDLRSLRQANAYREANFPGTRSRAKPESGVKVRTVPKEGRNGMFVYVVATHPKKGEPAKRFYVGTEKGFDPAKLSLRLEEARKWRAKEIANHNRNHGLVDR